MEVRSEKMEQAKQESEKIRLSGLDKNELEALMETLGEKKFRAGQVFPGFMLKMQKLLMKCQILKRASRKIK